MTLTREHLTILQRPFAPHEHEFLKGMTYITEDAITSRIEEVDPAWTLDVMNISSRDNIITCLVRLTINGVFRDGVGMNAITMTTDGKREANEAEKAAATDALKRAARLFGIGRYLLSLPSTVKDEATLTKYLNGNSPQTPPKQAATAPKSNGSSKPSTTTSATPENAPTHGEERQITLTAVISEAGKAGQTRYRFASVERLEGVYAYSREVFINGGWCTELDWQKHGTYNLEAACVATVQYHAFQDGGGGYWTVEAVENFQPDFLADVMNASAVTHDTTDQHIDDPLKGELLDITRVEPRSGKRFQWVGHARFEGQPITVLIFKEDERFIREAGYDTSGWDTPDGRTYRDGGIAMTTVKTTTGRQVASVWHISERRLVATERAS